MELSSNKMRILRKLKANLRKNRPSTIYLKREALAVCASQNRAKSLPQGGAVYRVRWQADAPARAPGAKNRPFARFNLRAILTAAETQGSPCRNAAVRVPPRRALLAAAVMGPKAKRRGDGHGVWSIWGLQSRRQSPVTLSSMKSGCCRRLNSTAKPPSM